MKKGYSNRKERGLGNEMNGNIRNTNLPKERIGLPKKNAELHTCIWTSRNYNFRKPSNLQKCLEPSKMGIAF